MRLILQLKEILKDCIHYLKRDCRMKKELENKIVNNYPNLFVDYSDDPSESCLTWGLSVNDGWYQLIDKLCGAIEHYLKNKPKVAFIMFAL